MRFAGVIWRVLVGVKDALVLLAMLLFFGLLYAALTVRPNTGAVKGGALLLDLSGSLTEQPATAAPLDVVAGGGALVREHRLRDVIHGLDRAAKDDRIKAVALDLDTFTGGGQTAIAEAGDALARVRASGKPVIAYASGYTDDGYQLAAHASEVWLNPMGAVLLTGPGGTNIYFKGLLDRLGVTANVYRVGAYKAAVEPFTRTDMSPEARADAQALANALWERWVEDVTNARSKAQVMAYVRAPDAAIAQAGGDMAQAALKAGLVDKLGDRSAFEARLAELAGPGAAGSTYRHTALDAWTAANPVGDVAGQVGVLTVAGNIVDGEAALGTAGAETIAAALHRGLESGRLKALVVRIDSPGGSSLASERIRQAVLRAKEKGIPVVVSMGSVAASGGYWIATAGDTIFAEPTTVTGSIGVFGILPSFEGALAKLGLGADGVKTTPLSGEPNVLRGFSPEADRLIQAGVDGTYRRFLSIVAQARKLPVRRVHEIAQGRVWDGGTARQIGLVDRFGTLEDAIAEARTRAKLDADARPVFLERAPTLLEQLATSFTQTGEDPAARDVFSRVAGRPQMLMMRAIGDATQMLEGSAIQARCLECGVSAGAMPRAGAAPKWMGLLDLR